MKTFYINDKKNSYVNEYVNSDGDYYSDLISYGKRVARYNHNTNEMSVYGWFSNTTARHINDFLEFYGFNRVTKEEMMDYKQ